MCYESILANLSQRVPKAGDVLHSSGMLALQVFYLCFLETSSRLHFLSFCGIPTISNFVKHFLAIFFSNPSILSFLYSSSKELYGISNIFK